MCYRTAIEGGGSVNRRYLTAQSLALAAAFWNPPDMRVTETTALLV